MDLSKLSTEELMRMRDAPAAPDLSKISTEELVKMRGSDQPDPTGSVSENVRAGAGKALVDASRGMEQAAPMVERGMPLPIRAAMTVGRNLREKLTGRTQDVVQAEVDESRRLDAPLTDTTSGTVGNVIGNVALAAPIPGGATYRGAATIGGMLGAAQPTATGESRPVNTAVGVAGGVVAKKAADVVGSAARNAFAGSQAKASASQAANVERDATLAAGREAGYVVPPSQAGGGKVTRAMESLSNKTNMQQAASARNQEVTNGLARKSLGLPDDAPLNEATLTALRERVAEPYRQIAAISPEAKAALEQLKEARFEATSYRRFYERSADPKALKESRFFEAKAADLEQEIERAATAVNLPHLLPDLRAARKMIAKSYTVENAIKEGTGNVDASKIASALNRNAPLSDELRVIAKFANKFPKATQTPEKTGSVPMATLTDVAMGGLGYQVDPTLGALALLRPAARNVALSRGVQNSIARPSYGPSGSLRVADMLANNPQLRRLAPGAGAMSAYELMQQ